MTIVPWLQGNPVAITVCDKHGIIIEMNDKAAEIFQKDGGKALIGQNLIDCHPEPSRSKVVDMLAHPALNSYTIEKNGVKKLIYQTPWFEDGAMAGIVEFSLEIPFVIPHFVRT
ncbi:MAG: PAS domain-containing protein [bacterium]|nr:PAS domain-containing protein [bacterium]